jgi:poly(3-hydroxybutyrate) depolymerase
MIYQIYDLQRMALGPVNHVAELARMALQNPLIPASYTKLGRTIAAGAELVERTTRQYAKPEFGFKHTVVDGKKVKVVEEVLGEKPFCRLIHFARDLPMGRKPDPQILVVAPMSGHYATLLRGTVEALLPEHDVYITDWVDARMVPLSDGEFGLDTYVEYLVDFMRGLGPETNVIAVCQPAVPVMCAVALLAAADDPAQPRSMTLMGGPIDVRAAPSDVTEFGRKHSLSWFKRSVVAEVPPYYPGALRKVYPGFIQLAGFMSMNVERHVGAYLKLFQHLVVGDGESATGHRKFYDEYLAVMDIPARFYLDTVEHVFQKASLPKRELTIRGKLVDPWKIRRTALLTIEGELDDISPPGQTMAAHKLCKNIPAHRRFDLLQKGVGHYGIFNGRKWREVIMPQVRDLIRDFDKPARLGSFRKNSHSPLPADSSKAGRLGAKKKATR